MPAEFSARIITDKDTFKVTLQNNNTKRSPKDNYASRVLSQNNNR